MFNACAIANFCLHVHLPVSCSEEGGSQMMVSNENVSVLCCVCVRSWVQNKATHDHDVDQM